MTLPARPRLALSQVVILSSDLDRDGRADAGDSLVFRFTVTNTGNRILSRLAITDRRLQTAGVAIRCTTTVLAPGARTSCTSGSLPDLAVPRQDGHRQQLGGATAITSSGQTTSSPTSVASARLVPPPAIVQQPVTVHQLQEAQAAGGPAVPRPLLPSRGRQER